MGLHGRIPSVNKTACICFFKKQKAHEDLANYRGFESDYFNATLP